MALEDFFCIIMRVFERSDLEFQSPQMEFESGIRKQMSVEVQ